METAPRNCRFLSLVVVVLNHHKSTRREEHNQPTERMATHLLREGKTVKGAQTMKCTLWTETVEFSRLKMPNSRFALRRLAPPSFTVCAPFCLQFTVYAPFSGRSWHLSRQPLFCQPLSSRFALHGSRALETGGFPTFLGKGPDCVADPFGTVPCRCC